MATKYNVQELHGNTLIRSEQFHDLAQAVVCRSNWERDLIQSVSFSNWLSNSSITRISFRIETVQAPVEGQRRVRIAS